jgi:AcrR family transcriptional regulator
MKTKDKILVTSIELFNRSGVVAITTNHIAKELNISPGNLYFHYANKEEIVQQLFQQMCRETYGIWKVKAGKEISLFDLIDANLDLYWRYRFFHREMYYLRRKDSKLAVMWRAHIKKMMALMRLRYKKWVQIKAMRTINDVSEMTYVAEVLLATATTFLQFFESAERVPTKKSLERAKRHIARLLAPYAEGKVREELEGFIQASK